MKLFYKYIDLKKNTHLDLTYYDDYTNKKLDFFKFRIDNNQPWKDEEPVYDNGWLMSDIFSYSDEAAQKIEKEMRAGSLL